MRKSNVDIERMMEIDRLRQVFKNDMLMAQDAIKVADQKLPNIKMITEENINLNKVNINDIGRKYTAEHIETLKEKFKFLDNLIKKYETADMKKIFGPSPLSLEIINKHNEYRRALNSPLLNIFAKDIPPNKPILGKLDDSQANMAYSKNLANKVKELRTEFRAGLAEKRQNDMAELQEFRGQMMRKAHQNTQEKLAKVEKIHAELQQKWKQISEESTKTGKPAKEMPLYKEWLKQGLDLRNSSDFKDVEPIFNRKLLERKVDKLEENITKLQNLEQQAQQMKGKDTSSASLLKERDALKETILQSPEFKDPAVKAAYKERMETKKIMQSIKDEEPKGPSRRP